jgi:hypothetical protein
LALYFGPRAHHPAPVTRCDLGWGIAWGGRYGDDSHLNLGPERLPRKR